MQGSPEVTTQVHIEIDGSPIRPDIEGLLQEIIVDQNAFLPGMFLIVLRDPDMALLDGGPFDLTKTIKISADNEGGATTVLIEGEITGLEPRFREGAIPDMVVRGYDKSHRLYRESKSEAYLNKKDSDLASEFAGEAGLSPQVDTTNTVYDVIYRDNQTPLAFLMQRAWRIGFECFVDAGKLYFRKPNPSRTSVTLKLAEDLLEFYPVISLAEQVDDVEVRGWNIDSMEPIVGTSSKGELYPQIGESKDGKTWAGNFGTGKKIIVDQPVVSQAEADVMAKARLNEISGAFFNGSGLAFRRPDIKAGQNVELQGVGRRLSGKYMVTSARHEYRTGKGLTTEFSVRGTRSGLLFEQMTHEPPVEKWAGVVPAVVTDTDDPKDLGRVKVKYPWMTEEAASDWARVISPGAGSERGFCLIPEVDDEVMVAFEHGDINYPYVLGGVWNGVNAIPPSTKGAGSGEKPFVRTWTSRSGHEITMYDDADNKIEIKTTGGNVFVLDDSNKKANLTTSGGHQMTCDDTSSTIEIKTSGGHKIVMDSSSVTIESTAMMTIKSGANMSIEAGAMMDIKANGILSLKGTMVNIN